MKQIKNIKEDKKTEEFIDRLNSLRCNVEHKIFRRGNKIILICEEILLDKKPHISMSGGKIDSLVWGFSFYVAFFCLGFFF